MSEMAVSKSGTGGVGTLRGSSRSLRGRPALSPADGGPPPPPAGWRSVALLAACWRPGGDPNRPGHRPAPGAPPPTAPRRARRHRRRRQPSAESRLTRWDRHHDHRREGRPRTGTRSMSQGQNVVLNVTSDDRRRDPRPRRRGTASRSRSAGGQRRAVTLDRAGQLRDRVPSLGKIIVILNVRVKAMRRSVLLVPLHGIASRHDLPLPFSFVLVGAALALTSPSWSCCSPGGGRGSPESGASAVPRCTRLDHPGSELVAGMLCWPSRLGRVGPVAGPGPADQPVFRLRVRLDVGRPGPVSLLLGQVWRATNPLRTVHPGSPRWPARSRPVWSPAHAAGGVAGRRRVVRLRLARAGAARSHHSGGAAGLGAGLAGDLDHRAVVFGQRWIGARDPFETYASTVARPRLGSGRGAACGWRIRWPTTPGGRPRTALSAVVGALLGSTAFDSSANT